MTEETKQELPIHVLGILKYFKETGLDDEEAEKSTLEAIDSAQNLSTQMLDFGYTAKEAGEASGYKLSNFITNIGISKVKMGKLYSLVDLNQKLMKLEGKTFNSFSEDDKHNILWSIGIDASKSGYFIDAGCFNYEDRRMCGLYVYGQERLDKEWLKLVIDGKNVASEEARYHKDRDALQIMRGNSKQ